MSGFDVDIRVFGLQLQNEIKQIGYGEKRCRKSVLARFFMPVRMDGEPDMHPVLSGQRFQGNQRRPQGFVAMEAVDDHHLRFEYPLFGEIVQPFLKFRDGETLHAEGHDEPVG